MFLPTGTKLINGERIALDTPERREFFERNLSHHLNKFLDKYSPIRRSVALYKDQRLKRKKNQFYSLMGQIALTHAAIEQDLKNTLLIDWGVKEKFNFDGKPQNMDNIYGRKLREVFIELLKNSMIPEDFLKEYEYLRDEFWALSEKRNEAVKAAYAFNPDTAEVSQIHEKNHSKYDGSMTYEEMINSWMPKVNLQDMNGLLQDLVALRGKFLNMRAKISMDKSKLTSQLCAEIGKTYPEYAFKNPYWYQATLKSAPDTKAIKK